MFYSTMDDIFPDDYASKATCTWKSVASKKISIFAVTLLAKGMIANHMISLIKNNLTYLCICLFFTLLLLCTAHFPFFWDTIQLAAKHALYFYDTHFSSIILPNEIDSGHIPTLGIYLAALWKVFGKSLLVSHLAMLPFVWGIVYQSLRLTNQLFPAQWRTWAALLLLADATLLAQCTLVSPDVLLVFFFIMALRQLLSKKKTWYSLALLGLTLSSTRGMMCAAAFGMAELIMENTGILKIQGITARIKCMAASLWKMLPAYIPAILVGGSFMAWHYHKTGWTGYHKNMPWYPLFEMVDIKGAARNMFILGWRLVDFGRLFVWMAGGFCLWHYLKQRPAVDAVFWKLAIVLTCIFLVLGQAVILHKSLSQHRYLLPVYLMVSLLVSYYAFHYIPAIRTRKIFSIVVLVGMLSGNCWVYPDSIAKGWDSTLAYLPYFPLRDGMIQFMKTEHIPVAQTGSPFPNHGEFRYFDLSDNRESFDTVNLKTNRYVFYSNVYNDFTDDELRELQTRWIKVNENRFMQVRVTLYKRR